ncbi:hypothetical protein [Mesorhizobium sp.]|uniref:hypothetical protein n=1 Tax=Mesorhizobium sp. TaxID=1871066 RepID=UPI00257F7E10|nr:hypothetical protein [Mesorhizobium sp.]
MHGKPENGFRYLGRELCRRFTTPMPHFTFWVYLILGVFVCGGFGIWFELVPYLYATNPGKLDGVFTALLTFFPTLVGSATLHLIFAENEKPLKAFSLLYCAGFVLLACWLGFAKPTDMRLAIGGATVGAVASVLIWWLANGLDPAFQDQLTPNAPVGGDTDVAPPGDLSGFKV